MRACTLSQWLLLAGLDRLRALLGLRHRPARHLAAWLGLQWLLGLDLYALLALILPYYYGRF